MSNEIVRYKNKFNKLHIGGVFTRPQNNIFIAIISRLQHTAVITYDKNGVPSIGTKPIYLSYDQIKRLSGNHYGRHHARFMKDLINTQDKMLKISMYHNDTHIFSHINLFSKFDILKDRKECRIKLNSDFYDWLNMLKRGFTRFSLHQLVHLPSSFAQNMFRYIKTFRLSGVVIIKIDKLQRLLGFSKNYTGNQIQNRVIRPIEIELTPLIKGLHVMKITKGGHKIVGYKFTFSPETGKTDDFSHGTEKDLKKAINNVRYNPYLKPKLKKKALKRLMPSNRRHQHEPIKVFNRTLKRASLEELKYLYKIRNTNAVNFSEYQVRKLRKTIKHRESKSNTSTEALLKKTFRVPTKKSKKYNKMKSKGDYRKYQKTNNKEYITKNSKNNRD